MSVKSAKDIFGLAFAVGRSRIARQLPRNFHHPSAKSATPLPLGGVGPPPSPPLPAASQYGDRIERRRKQAQMLQQAKDLRASGKQQGKQSPLKKRFWKDVDIKETPDGYQIFLDSRPVRNPNKIILTIPLSKPNLAHAIALEWDVLTSAQQALKNHNIPLTSLTSRADDIARQEAQQQQKGALSQPRSDILKTVMRYLDTDTLLCCAPSSSDSPEYQEPHPGKSLRDVQRLTAQPILSYLNTFVWPGAELHPILDETSILPRQQPEMTKSIIAGWIAGLPAYELAALERGVLASKSLLVATRLLVEWSEEFRDVQKAAASGGTNSLDDGKAGKRFGIEEAAEACSTEVRWQTGMWGEVEDTHDVEREDLRRQLGSLVVLVSGTKGY